MWGHMHKESSAEKKTGTGFINCVYTSNAGKKFFFETSSETLLERIGKGIVKVIIPVVIHMCSFPKIELFAYARFC